VAIVQSATSGSIAVDPSLYTLIAVALALVGVYLARLVTIDAENKRLGRVQTLRETGPLTWIGVLIVCPLIWHFNIAVPWASMIGLGVGYSVRLVLKIFGSGAAGAARAFVRQAAAEFDEQPAPPPAAPPLDAPGARHVAVILPPDKVVDPMQGPLLAQLDELPDTPPLPPRSKKG
jgi:hypothetical protein